jgi:RND family efflux transporter MFP subunit
VDCSTLTVQSRCGLTFFAALVLGACGSSENAKGVATPLSTVSRPLVTVVQPVEKAVRTSITLPATVEAFAQVTLYAKVSGYLERIAVDKGDTVAREAVLAQLEVPEVDKQYESAAAALEQARAEAQRAAAESTFKQVSYERLVGVRESQPDVVAQQDLDTAHAAYLGAQSDVKLTQAKTDLARAELGRLDALRRFARIVAPFPGVITARYVDPGALIQQGAGAAGTPVVTIANIDTVRVYVNVPEDRVAQVDRGKPVMVLLDALPGQGLAGKITRYAHALDVASRTMRTEIDLPNPDHRILPGMYGAAALQLAASGTALFVPPASLRHDAQGHAFVYVVEKGRLHIQLVETGMAQDGMLSIRGVTPGSAVVLSATAELYEGLAVTAVGTTS